MSAASYYDKAATQEETSHLSSTSGQQPGPMHSGTQGYGQDMREGMNEQQQQRGVPQEGYNQQSGNGIYNGQEPNMGNTNYAHGAQQMNGNNNYAQGAQQMEGNGAQGAVADDRDTITKCNDNPPDYKENDTRNSLFDKYMFDYVVKRFDCTRWLATDCRSTNITFLICFFVSTIVLDRIEKKFGGDRFNNPENAEKNKELNANILKRVKQVMGMVMRVLSLSLQQGASLTICRQRGPGMLMNMVK